MPAHISRERWIVLEPLLDAALDVAQEERDSFLRDSCDGDDALHAEVIQLLVEFGHHDTLLDRPAAERFAALMADAPPALPDVLSDRYHIEREIARGGMAIVYLARDLRHERQVAVKVLRPEVAEMLGVERFLAEIKLTAQLQHPHILPLHDSGSANGLLYYVMPYVEGESLRVRMERERHLPLRDAVRITVEVASALAAAHQQGVIHRDVKPENILLHNGTAMVADFGIGLALTATTPRVTQPGSHPGTPQYMSPEQATGDGTIDSRADTYALGTVLYEMLAGEAPFTGASATSIIAKRLATSAPSVRVLRPTVPLSIDAAVARALAREPADRYRTVSEFADTLTEALAEDASGDAMRRLDAPLRRQRTRVFAAVVVVLLGVAGVAGVAIWKYAPPTVSTSTVAPDAKSIAVLPFTFVGSDTANRYFATGMADFLGSAIGNVPGTRVIPSRSTATLAKPGHEVDFKDVSKEFGVATVLQGSVLRAGDQMQVTIQLVSATTGGQIWGDTYQHTIRQATDVFSVQDNIVRDIVGQLQITLVSPVTPAHPHTKNLEALDLYTQGRILLDPRTSAGIVKARRYFERALAIDPNLAEAYSGLADINITFAIGNQGDSVPSNFYPKARELAMRAISLNPASPDAHASLGAVKVLFDLDWAGAESELTRAIALDRQSPMAHLWRAVLFAFTGRFGEAVTEARAGLDADPRSRYARMEFGRALFFDKQYGRAADQFRAVLDSDSSVFRAHLLLGQVYEQTNMLDSAVARMTTAVRLNPTSSRARAFLAHAYAVAGRKGDAARELSALHDRRKKAYIPAFDFAVAYVGLGDLDNTFEWLNRSFDDRSLRPYLLDPTFDSIRSDPRYQALLRRMKHPQAKPAG